MLTGSFPSTERASLVRVVVAGSLLGLLTPLRVYPDSIGYLESASSLFSSEFSQQYSWIREPLYPVFLRGLMELPGEVGTVALPAIQGGFIALGLWMLTISMVRLGMIRRVEPAAYYPLSCLLLLGYSGAVLQQALFILVGALLVTSAVRLSTGDEGTGLWVFVGFVSAASVMLSSVFVPSVLLLPLATVFSARRRVAKACIAALIPAALALALWMCLKAMLQGSPVAGLPGMLGSADFSSLSVRIPAVLATFGVWPDFYQGVQLGAPSASNLGIGLLPYFDTSCVHWSLTQVPASDLTGGTLCTLRGRFSFPVLPYRLLMWVGVVQVYVAAAALIASVWLTKCRGPFVLCVAILALPGLPVAMVIGDGNSRYGLPLLALGLVLTGGLLVRPYNRLSRTVQKELCGST